MSRCPPQIFFLFSPKIVISVLHNSLQIPITKGMRKAALRSSFSTNSGTVIALQSLIMLLTLQILSWFISFRFLFLFFNHSNILWEIKKERTITSQT